MTPKVKYTQLFIDNEFVNSKSGKTFPTINPADESVIAQISEADKVDVDLAVAAAKRALQHESPWRLLDASERGRLLMKFANLLERDAEYLAQLETLDNGIVASFAKMTLASAVDVTRYIASLADKIQGDTIPADGEVFSMTLKQPVGVVALIMPWNVPIVSFAHKVIPALAAGCTIVVKPAEQTPLTTLALAALMKEAGLPKGVLNIVQGFGDTVGAPLSLHPDIAKISFTGSNQVGKIIQRAAGTNNLKRVTLELGGKSPLVIMNDADLERAASFAATSVFSHQGQVCVAASRVFVQSGVYDKFVQLAVEKARAIKVGDPNDPTTNNGPQADQESFKTILNYIELGKKEGANLLTGGYRVGNTGYYIQPAVFSDVKDDMTIAKEEIFGPVQSILKFETFEEVITRANATEYGLAAGIFTKDMTKALQYCKRVDAGIIWVNQYHAAGPQDPFGGLKDSGFGQERGVNALEPYLDVKNVSFALPKKLETN